MRDIYRYSLAIILAVFVNQFRNLDVTEGYSNGMTFQIKGKRGLVFTFTGGGITFEGSPLREQRGFFLRHRVPLSQGRKFNFYRWIAVQTCLHLSMAKPS